MEYAKLGSLMALQLSKFGRERESRNTSCLLLLEKPLCWREASLLYWGLHVSEEKRKLTEQNGLAQARLWLRVWNADGVGRENMLVFDDFIFMCSCIM